MNKQSISEGPTSDALKRSGNKYQNLHMSMMDGYVFVDMQGQIIDSNVAYQQMVGYNADELSRLTYSDLTPVSWHDFEQKIVLEQILPEKHSIVYQKEYIKKDGTIFPVELRTFLIQNDVGENEGMWAIVRDITDRKRVEEALRKSEEKFRNIVESSPTAMYFYQLDGPNRLVLTGANPAADQIIGISHQSLLGKTIEEAFPNLFNTDIPEIYRKVARDELGSQSFEIGYTDERFSGFYYVHVFRTGPNEIAVDFMEITKRRQMEEALRRSEIEYRDMLDALPDWIYVVDGQNRIAIINEALKRELILNGLESGCIGQELSEKFPFITSDTINGIKTIFTSGNVSAYEQRFELDGKLVHAEVSLVPIFKDRIVTKVIMMVRDRSKEKEIEELKQRNSEQKEVLLREIHHRVKNNLAIVISLLNFQLRNSSSDELNRIITDIQMRIRSMALIHEHLYRSENLDLIPLATYIESLSYKILTTYSGHRISLINDLDPIDASIGIALPIGLIINELVTNAFKYAFPDGAKGEIKIMLKKAENHICTLVVKDNGIGLPSSSNMDSEKSLGLYIVRLLAEQLDGSVKITRNNGTTFQISFRNILPEHQAH